MAIHAINYSNKGTVVILKPFIHDINPRWLTVYYCLYVLQILPFSMFNIDNLTVISESRCHLIAHQKLSHTNLVLS